MSLLTISVCYAIGLIVLLIGKNGYRYYRVILANQSIIENELLAYKRALGLPVFSTQACMNELWARSMQDDQTAKYLLNELIMQDFHKDDQLTVTFNQNE